MDSAENQTPSLSLSAGMGMKIYRYRNLIRRHWWILCLTVGCGLAAEGYLLFTKPQMYESKSELFVREELVTEGAGAKSFQDLNGNGKMLDTGVETLKNPVVLENAKNQLALTSPNLHGSAIITSGVTPRTSILTVAGTGTNPEYTQKYVAAVVAEFLSMRQSARSDAVVGRNEDINDIIGQLRKDLETQKIKLQTFIETHNMAFWKEQGESAARFLSSLKNQQATLKNALQRLENLTPDQLLLTPMTRNQPTRNEEGSTGSAGTVSRQDAPFNSDLYSQYTLVTQQLIQKQAELEEWKKVWKPKHPKLQRLETQTEDLQRLLGTIKKQNVEATKSQAVAIKAELNSLESSIAVWDAKLLEASRKDAEYNTLQSDVARTHSQLERLMGSSTELGNGKKTGADPFFVMHRASPAIPVPPGTIKHLLLGLVGGLLVGGIILYIMDRVDDRLTSSTEMLEHFSEAILGQIPDVADSRGETGLPLLDPEDERYSYAEAFRSLRSSLIFMPNQGDLKSLLITSAIPNEGKSTIASNLAITMAAAGARVLLVDADLRRGDLAQIFDTDGLIGLSNILKGEVNWKEAVHPTKYATLSLIARGPVTNRSGELLLKPSVPALLDEFKRSYDLTIFNTAPILAADDTPTLAPNFDGTLMVIRAQFTSARLSVNALNSLYQRQVNVLGLILNCVDTETPDYYYYRYPKYYAA